MSKNKKKKKGGYKAPAKTCQNVIDEIAKLANEISAVDEAGSLWGQLHKLFLKSPVEPDVAAKIIMHKDVEELKQVVGQLQHGEKATVESEHSELPLPELSHETKKQLFLLVFDIPIRPRPCITQMSSGNQTR